MLASPRAAAELLMPLLLCRCIDCERPFIQSHLPLPPLSASSCWHDIQTREQNTCICRTLAAIRATAMMYTALHQAH